MELNLLNTGGPNKGKLEAAADILMKPVSKLLFGRSVTYTENDGFSRKRETYAPSNINSSESMILGGFGFIVLSPLILAAGLLISIPCAIGLALKKIAVIKDKKSASYQEGVKAYLQYEKALISKEKLLYNTGISRIERKIHTASQFTIERMKNNVVNKLKDKFNILDITDESTEVILLADKLFQEYQKALEDLKQIQMEILKKNDEAMKNKEEKINKTKENLVKFTKEYANA